MTQATPFTAPLMYCPDCGETFYAGESHDTFCGFPGHGRIARWWRRRGVPHMYAPYGVAEEEARAAQVSASGSPTHTLEGGGEGEKQDHVGSAGAGGLRARDLRRGTGGPSCDRPLGRDRFPRLYYPWRRGKQ